MANKKHSVSKEMANGCNTADAQNPRTSGLFSQFILLDQRWTNKWALCASDKSRYGVFRPIMKLLEISGHGVPWISIPLLLFVVSTDDYVLQMVTNLLLAMFFDLAVVGTVKGIVRRPRPPVNVDDMFLTIAVDNFSFPSGHCTRAGMVTWIYILTLDPAWLPSLAATSWSLCIALSRVILGRHHFSDVACGLLIGYLQALVVCYFWLPIETCQNIRQVIFYKSAIDEL
ncbi:phospholipid phosphatase 6-like isoform X1 [Anneissia japonica]|uniref:phospholipid phosphatase 6-like isoform X1 n=1 Tax=Anneissia japonica TaxID=1529436 RepID=UPI0014259718|nr:phospholipid phosphatase 6-like isoform X1 [Anneissia japonica]